MRDPKGRAFENNACNYLSSCRCGLKINVTKKNAKKIPAASADNLECSS